MTDHHIITIGASAGGLKPLRDILSGLPVGFPASLFVVLHLSPQSPSELAGILDRSSRLPVKWAEDEEAVQPGVVYVAPADRHLLLNDGQMRVLFGARESGARPSIDMLFRSAAVAYRSRVVGVILSGTLDDGARGLLAIKRCEGTAVVLDPKVAAEPEMPRNALQAVDADHCLASHEIAPLLQNLVERWVPSPGSSVPEDVALENRVAQNALTGTSGPEAGDVSPVACPDCGGQLRRYGDGRDARYRCHVGHAYSTSLLLDRQREQLEQAIWIAVRAIGDRQRVLDRLAEDYRKRGRTQMARSMAERSEELAQQTSVLRSVLAGLSRGEPAVDEPSVPAAGS